MCPAHPAVGGYQQRTEWWRRAGHQHLPSAEMTAPGRGRHLRRLLQPLRLLFSRRQCAIQYSAPAAAARLSQRGLASLHHSLVNQTSSCQRVAAWIVGGGYTARVEWDRPLRKRQLRQPANHPGLNQRFFTNCWDLTISAGYHWRLTDLLRRCRITHTYQAGAVLKFADHAASACSSPL